MRAPQSRGRGRQARSLPLQNRRAQEARRRRRLQARRLLKRWHGRIKRRLAPPASTARRAGRTYAGTSRRRGPPCAWRRVTGGMLLPYPPRQRLQGARSPAAPCARRRSGSGEGNRSGAFCAAGRPGRIIHAQCPGKAGHRVSRPRLASVSPPRALALRSPMPGSTMCANPTGAIPGRRRTFRRSRQVGSFGALGARALSLLTYGRHSQLDNIRIVTLFVSCTISVWSLGTVFGPPSASIGLCTGMAARDIRYPAAGLRCPAGVR